MSASFDLIGATLLLRSSLSSMAVKHRLDSIVESDNFMSAQLGLLGLLTLSIPCCVSLASRQVVMSRPLVVSYFSGRRQLFFKYYTAALNYSGGVLSAA